MYKTFNDLEFYTHRTGFGKQARMDFPNGYGVSVITGDMFYMVMTVVFWWAFNSKERRAGNW